MHTNIQSAENQSNGSKSAGPGSHNNSNILHSVVGLLNFYSNQVILPSSLTISIPLSKVSPTQFLNIFVKLESTKIAF